MAADGKVASRHTLANELIETLRGFHADLARKIAELGDAAYDAAREVEDERRHFHAAQAEADEANAGLAEWRELLEDFKRGIRDRDELIEGTVGV